MRSRCRDGGRRCCRLGTGWCGADPIGRPGFAGEHRAGQARAGLNYVEVVSALEQEHQFAATRFVCQGLDLGQDFSIAAGSEPHLCQRIGPVGIESE